MESCSRSGGRSFDLGIDGLVSGIVPELGVDIRRKRHPSEAIEDLHEDAPVIEAEDTESFLFDFQARRQKVVLVPERDDSADLHGLGIADQTQPFVFLSFKLPQKQDFDVGMCFLLFAQ